MSSRIWGSVPWKAQGFTWRDHLSGSPLKLLVICILQTTLLIFGVLIGIGRADCPITVHSGSDITVDCANCTRHAYVTWQQILLLFVGMGVVLIGVCAAILRSKKLCRIYGLIMMVYSFVIGLTSLLTGLDSIVLSDAIKTLEENDTICAEDVRMMITTTRINAILFAINAILDIAGAIFAIKSKELFEFQEIAQHHSNFQRSYAPL